MPVHFYRLANPYLATLVMTTSVITSYSIHYTKLYDLATPHIAGYSVDGKANGTAMSVQAISEKFNLPLKDWYPDDLPLPDEANIQLDAGEIDIQQNLVKAIIHTYNIKDVITSYSIHYTKLYDSEKEEQ